MNVFAWEAACSFHTTAWLHPAAAQGTGCWVTDPSIINPAQDAAKALGPSVLTAELYVLKMHGLCKSGKNGASFLLSQVLMHFWLILWCCTKYLETYWLIFLRDNFLHHIKSLDLVEIHMDRWLWYCKKKLSYSWRCFLQLPFPLGYFATYHPKSSCSCLFK